MKRIFLKSFVLGSFLLTMGLVPGPMAWGQHGGHGGHGGGHSGHGGGHSGHSGGHFGGIHFGSHSFGHDLGRGLVHELGHSLGHNIGHSIGHSFNGGYGGHFGGSHYLTDFGHHIVHPHYDHYSSYGGYYPSYGVTSTVPYGVTFIAPANTIRSRAVFSAPVANRNVVNKPAVGNNNANIAAYQASAKKAFQNGQFNEASRLTSHALVESPNNTNMHLFLSHALFAGGDYRGAAIEIHRAAAIGGIEELGHHVKNWKSIYRNTQYTNAMKRLNNVVRDNPNDATLRFLRGYHFMFLNQADYAKRELAKALELEPKDRLAADLLAKLSGNSPSPLVLPAPPTVAQPVELQPAKSVPADTPPDLSFSNRAKKQGYLE